MITSIVKADGADLYVERRSDGPPLLMIAGGGGDGGVLTTLGGHSAPMELPAPFAAGLRDVFGRL